MRKMSTVYLCSGQRLWYGSDRVLMSIALLRELGAFHNGDKECRFEWVNQIMTVRILQQLG